MRILMLSVATCWWLGTTPNLNLVAGEMPVVMTREAYQEVPFDELPEDIITQGSDPEAMAKAAFGAGDMSAEEGNFQETVTVDYTNESEAIVILTQTGLLDDSVYGIRYRLDFQRLTTGDTWEMMWVGRQYSCRQGRGSQDWSPALCL